MAKFRNGNLVLTSTQEIVQGSRTVLDDTSLGFFNSLKLDLGATITSFSTDGTMVGNSDSSLPTEKAVVTYVTNQLAIYATNKIYQLDTKVEVLDTGLDGTIWFYNDNSFSWKITPTGKLINYDLAEGLTVNSTVNDIQLLGGGAGVSSPLLGRFTNDGSESTVKFLKSRSTTPGSYTTVQVGDNIGSIYWNGDDGSSYNPIAARILGEAGDTISTGIVSGKLKFFTSNSSGTSTERFRISDDGTIISYSSININSTVKATGYLYSGSTDPTNSSRLNYDGYFYATRVYNAVWNDIADFQDLVDNLVPGKCYFDAIEGAKICDIRCQRAVIGIASDTYGHGVGQVTDKKQVPIAVCGWVLAYVDGECEIGDALTNNYNGNLIKMTDEEKCKYPERIVATYKKKESGEYFGPNKEVKVNGRHWVKVK